MTNVLSNRNFIQFQEKLHSQILLLDGAMGSLIQKLKLKESDFRGELFIEHNSNLLGNYDILSLSKPEIILNIHLKYLKSGADIIETNSFNSNEISQRDYGTEKLCYNLNKASAQLAVKAREMFYKSTKQQTNRYVAGSIGPSNVSLNLSEEYNFDSFKNAYKTQIEGLIDGGVDCLIVETVYDSSSCKAILAAIKEVFEIKNVRLPIIVSATIDKLGRNFIGETLQTFYKDVVDYDYIVAIGLNCSFGLDLMKKYIRELSIFSKIPISVYSNAGIPDNLGNYKDTPEIMSNLFSSILTEPKVRLIGGCCGTTPNHIKALSNLLQKHTYQRFPILY